MTAPGSLPQTPEVVTERLWLRRVVGEDLERWHRLVFSDPDVMRYLPSGVPVSLERARDVFRRFEEGWDRRGVAPWGVEVLETGELIGHCGLRHVDELPGEIEVLYALGRRFWGRGYATEAAGASLRFGFEEVGAPRILAFAMPQNGTSRRVMEKLGMSYLRRARLFGIEAVVYELDRASFDPGHAPYRVGRAPSPKA